MSSIENNNRRVEIQKRIVSLADKLNRVKADLYQDTKKEIKVLEDELKSLPPVTLEGGNVYLKTKISYANDRYKVVNFKGKFHFYDDTECLSSQVIVDENGKPCKAIVSRINSETHGELVNIVYNLKIDAEEPKAPVGKPIRLKFGRPDDWKCPLCLFENPVEYDACFGCRHPRPENLAIKL